MATETTIDAADPAQQRREFDAQRDWHFGLRSYMHVTGMRQIDRAIRRAVLDRLYWDPDVSRPHEDTFRRTRLLDFHRSRPQGTGGFALLGPRQSRISDGVLYAGFFGFAGRRANT